MKKILMLTSDPRLLDRRIAQQAASLAETGDYRVVIAHTNPSLEKPHFETDLVSYLSAPIYPSQSSDKTNFWKVWSSLRAYGAEYLLLIRLYQFLVATLKDVALDWRRRLSDFNWPQSDLVICHDVPLLPTALLLRDRGLTNRVLLDAHEIFDLQYDAIYSAKARRYWNRICREYKPKCDAIITVSDGVADIIYERFSLADRPAVVKNAAPFCKRADKEIGRRLLDQLYDIRDYSKVVICAGELRHGRNLEELIEAISHLKDHSICLVFLGYVSPGFLKVINRLRGHHNLKNVFFGQAVGSEKLISYLSGADLGIVPNRGQGPNNTLGAPNRLFEYIQGRLPILYYQHTGIRTVANGTSTSLEVEWKSPEELANAISFCLQTFDSRSPAFDIAASQICWEREFEAFREVVKKVMA